MRALFIGGTGLISSACSPLAVDRGMDLTLINRGQSAKAKAPAGARELHVDIHDVQALRDVLHADVAAHGRYDAVVQWICFTPDHARQDIETFADITDQYVFISSASAYQTPPEDYVTTEQTPLDNPFWQYSRDKATIELLLREAAHESHFPFTIVRPSHTYGYSEIPLAIAAWDAPWTAIDRIESGKKFIVHGDGTSLWTLTDHRDFAVGLVGLLGNPKALGEDFTITSDDVLTWNQIHEYVGAAVGVSAEAIAAQSVFIPSTLLAQYDREAFEGPLLGDKANAGVFDTSKLRAVVPDFNPARRFKDGIHESIAWHRADPSRLTVDAATNARWDALIERYERAIAAFLGDSTHTTQG
ncbi:NAD-dependent epimerase/dehydratase family protein [Demequina oxidasica]|uniref:NAD-dependent epimerase/dehydratase family protein n=1 Tax=Demequina oxidasica TaxID=676199 RepID=UPI00078608F9|nr:NAD-dependent epimerase/dehydratase family protein [Demequina oxidasica]